MIRTLLLTLALVVVLGGSYYLFFSGKDADEQQAVADTAVAQVQPASDAKAPVAAGAKPTAPPSGEFWTQRCNEEGDKHCEVFQRLLVEETKQRLVEFAVGYPADLKGQAQAVVILPLGVLVSEGVALTVDGKSPARAVFRTCGTDGCIVAVNLPEEFLKLMKSGKILGVSFIDGGSGKQVNVGLSLEGFGAKIDKIKP